MDYEEVWRFNPRFDNIMVSTEGRFINSDTGNERQVVLNGRGYPYLPMFVDGKHTSIHAGRLVAETFLSDFRPGKKIRYHDGDPSNIRVDNLECVGTLFRRAHPLRPMRSQRVRVIELDKIFVNVTAAAIFIDGHATAIYRCLRHEQETHLGYTFEYVSVRSALDRMRREQDA